jgi:hypothetical protein
MGLEVLRCRVRLADCCENGDGSEWRILDGMV